jgi:hypothetical protein
MHMPKPVLAVILMLSPLAARTAAPAPLAPADTTPAQAEAARQALVDWFECEECEERQLEAVKEHGQLVVPLLKAALLKGAAPATRELARRGLSARYDELQKYAETHDYAKPASSKEEFVEHGLKNLDAQYRVRASQALSVIGGRAAREALEAGAAVSPRADVRDSIKAALAEVR